MMISNADVKKSVRLIADWRTATFVNGINTGREIYKLSVHVHLDLFCTWPNGGENTSASWFGFYLTCLLKERESPPSSGAVPNVFTVIPSCSPEHYQMLIPVPRWAESTWSTFPTSNLFRVSALQHTVGASQVCILNRYLGNVSKSQNR